VSKRLLVLLVAIASTFSSGIVLAGEGWNPLSGATAQGSIINTRHNLTMSYLGAAAQLMDSYRNNYGEICVYCHTPHGANAQVDAPLWNRTINTSQYQVFDKVRTLNQPITQPGPNSLTCLSCHDGTISPDSIINMPGSGRYNKTAETVWDPNALDAWARDYGGKGPIGLGSVGHKRLQKTPSGDSCMACHNPSEVNTSWQNGLLHLYPDNRLHRCRKSPFCQLVFRWGHKSPGLGLMLHHINKETKYLSDDRLVNRLQLKKR